MSNLVCKASMMDSETCTENGEVLVVNDDCTWEEGMDANCRTPLLNDLSSGVPTPGTVEQVQLPMRSETCVVNGKSHGFFTETCREMGVSSVVPCVSGPLSVVRTPGAGKQVLIPVSQFLQKMTGRGSGRVTQVTQTKSGIHIVVVEEPESQNEQPESQNEQPESQNEQLESQNEQPESPSATSTDASTNLCADPEDISKFDVFNIKPKKKTDFSMDSQSNITHANEQRVYDIKWAKTISDVNRNGKDTGSETDSVTEEIVDIETVSESDTDSAREGNKHTDEVIVQYERDEEMTEAMDKYIVSSDTESSDEDIGEEEENVDDQYNANGEQRAKVLETSTGYFCNVCLKAFDRQLCCESHVMADHNKTLFRCVIEKCCKSYGSFDALKDHWVRRHRIYFYTCHICKMGFVDRHTLIEHCKKCKVEWTSDNDLAQLRPEPQSNKYFDSMCKHCSKVHVTPAQTISQIKEMHAKKQLKRCKQTQTNTKACQTNYSVKKLGNVLQRVHKRGGFNDVYNQCKKCLAAVNTGAVRIPGKPRKNIKRTMMLELVDIGDYVGHINDQLKLPKFPDIQSSFVKQGRGINRYMCIICGAESNRKYMAMSHYVMYHEMARDKSSLLGLNKDDWVTLL